MPDPDLTWTETEPSLWRSTDGRYAILRTQLPGPAPNVIYTLRKIDPASARAYPGTAGYFRAERWSLSEAKRTAATDAYCDDHGAERHVPEDYPALALAWFFWPISEGTTRAALAISRDGDRVVASVIGMARGEDAFEPTVYAEIDLSGQQGLVMAIVDARGRSRIRQRAERSKGKAAR
jgi:hypothetical protein